VAEHIDDLDKPTRRKIEAAVNIDLVGVVRLSLTGSPTSQSPRTRSLRIQLDMAEEVIRQQEDVGDLTGEHRWIEARAEMTLGKLPGGKTVLFCGYVGDLLVVLSGSESNLMESPSAPTQEGSQLYAVKEALEDSGWPGELGSALQAAAQWILEMPPQPVRFLARVLARETLADDPERTRYMLATPLYVEEADRAETKPKDASRQEPRPTAKELPDRRAKVTGRDNGHEAMRPASGSREAVEPDQAGKQPPPTTHLPNGTRRRRRMLVSAVAACLVAAGVAGVLLHRTPASAPTPGRSQMAGQVDLMPDHNGVPVEPQPSPALPATPEARMADPGSEGVQSVAFSPDDRIVAAADYGGSAYLWRALPPRAYTIIGKGVQDPSSDLIWDAVLSPDGTTFATADNDGDAVIRSVAGLQNPVAMLPGPPSASAFAIAYDPENPLVVAVGYSDGDIYLWNYRQNLIAMLTDPSRKGVRGIAFNPQGTMLAAGGVNGYTYIFDVQNHQRVADLHAPGSKQVYGVAFSPEGNVLAAADNNGDAYLWDVATHARIMTLPSADGKGLTGVAFSPFGRVLAAADADGHILLWDVTTYKRIGTLPDPGSEGVQGVAFSLDGNTLAAADGNGWIYLWNVSALNS
jgi:WD40 repeat protein